MLTDATVPQKLLSITIYNSLNIAVFFVSIQMTTCLISVDVDVLYFFHASILLVNYML